MEFLINRADYTWRMESKTTPPCDNAYPFEYLNKKDPGKGVAQWGIKFDTLQDLYEFKQKIGHAIILEQGCSEYVYTDSRPVPIGEVMPLIQIYDDYIE